MKSFHIKTAKANNDASPKSHCPSNSLNFPPSLSIHQIYPQTHTPYDKIKSTQWHYASATMNSQIGEHEGCHNRKRKIIFRCTDADADGWKNVSSLTGANTRFNLSSSSFHQTKFLRFEVISTIRRSRCVLELCFLSKN